MGQQQQMPSTAYTMVATPQQQPVIGGVGQAQRYLQQPPRPTFMPGIQIQQQPHVNPMVQNPGLQLGYPSGYIVPNMGMAYQ
jgi:hypothetical protein